MIGSGFADEIARRMARALIIAALAILTTGVGCGLLIGRMWK